MELFVFIALVAVACGTLAVWALAEAYNAEDAEWDEHPLYLALEDQDGLRA